MIGKAQRLQQASRSIPTSATSCRWLLVQDAWKVSQRVTLSAGLRWEMYPVFKDRFGKMTSYAAGAQSKRFPNAPAGLVFVGDAEYPYRDDRNNLGPRLGVAWDVFGTGRTSVRSSFGVFYEPLTGEMSGGRPACRSPSA